MFGGWCANGVIESTEARMPNRATLYFVSVAGDHRNSGPFVQSHCIRLPIYHGIARKSALLMSAFHPLRTFGGDVSVALQ